MSAKWILLLFPLTLIAPFRQAQSVDSTQYWIKVHATNSFERSVIANTGASIEMIQDDYVIVTANIEERKALQRLGWIQADMPLVSAQDFPTGDGEYHNYTEVTQALEKLASEYPDLVRLSSIGMSQQDRNIWSLVISEDVDHSQNKPAVLYLGGHHAREHLSVEVPLRFVQWMLAQYKAGNSRVTSLIKSRQIHLIPSVNPDGLEYDVEGGRYKSWRKNRRANRDGTFGVDLNRNYGFKWGTGGSSSSTNSDTYMGPTPFSEPETQAIKLYIETHTNISILLSFHTFSELILYPWGHSNSRISNDRDFRVHEVMAQKMSIWNNYTPEQASSLYIASGDLTDWSYGAQKVISFTFELDPKGQWGNGGFYPGAGAINTVLDKNIEPCLYLLEHADNPYRVLDGN